jgi:hypothetical protein
MLEYGHAGLEKTERFPKASRSTTMSGDFQECFNSTARGYTMPAFSFEKISPPVRRGPIAPIEQKQRGVIVQILGRFVERRVRRRLKAEKGEAALRQQEK